MNMHTRMSGKGQVVIPKDVRDAHDWREGVDLEVIDRPDGVLLRRRTPQRKRISMADFKARIAPHDGPAVSIEEMDAAVLKIAAERYRRS
jgi:AbrB family looped-hinge helix DNA binding protein